MYRRVYSVVLRVLRICADSFILPYGFSVAKKTRHPSGAANYRLHIPTISKYHSYFPIKRAAPSVYIPSLLAFARRTDFHRNIEKLV